MSLNRGHYVSMHGVRSPTARKPSSPAIYENPYENPYASVSSWDGDTTSVDGETPPCSCASGSSSGTSDRGIMSDEDDDVYAEIRAPETRKVVLHPGTSGIGMSIAGGVVYRHIRLPVFVTDIDRRGLADLSGVIQVGDRIVSVNGEILEGGSHRDVVLAIKAAGSNLVLELARGPHNIKEHLGIR